MKMALTRIGKEKIRQLTPITEGGEGYIYEFGNDILKIYKPCVDIVAKEKKVAMLIDKPLPKEAIKPITAVYDNNNKFIGFGSESSDNIRGVFQRCVQRASSRMHLLNT